MATGMQGERLWSAEANSGNVALFRFAKAVSGNKFDRAAGGEVTIGVFTDVAGSAVPCTVQLDGVGKVELATTLVAGVLVQSDADGKATTHSSGFAAGTLLTGGDAGDIVSVKLP